ncbi:hypothetical protein HQ585_01820 [candidate division KSB1 bacterium]|nr:hypothetical protein [candidate division KSB1 bacterium]
MKRLIFVFMIILTVSCIRDKLPFTPVQSDFTPTDHVIGTMGETMCLSIRVPVNVHHVMSADSNKIQLNQPNCYLIPRDEMIQLVQNLSDTTVFHWEFMTAVTPYPDEDCVLLAHLENLDGYMCSIGSGNNAGVILHKLINRLLEM